MPAGSSTLSEKKKKEEKVCSLLQTSERWFDLPNLMGFFLAARCPDMESTLQEERMAKVQVEEKLLQLKKDHSMLDCDYKMAQNKLDELQAQKEKLCDEVHLPSVRSPAASAATSDLTVFIGRSGEQPERAAGAGDSRAQPEPE